MQRRLRWLSLPGLLAWALGAVAAPTVGELRAICARALAAGYVGEEAAMCDWYVAPCGICGKDGPPPKQWCVPAHVEAAEVAGAVVQALTGGDDARPAPAVVEEILRQRYPCAAEE